jgi:hypothetical protein
MKGCEASGRLTVERVLGAISHVEVMEKYGVKKNRRLNLITLSGTGGSGYLGYKNSQNENKGFQLGGLLHRNTFEPKIATTKGKRKRGSNIMERVLDTFLGSLQVLGLEAWAPYLKQYFAEITVLMENCSPVFLNRKSQVLTKSPWKETLLAASNMVTDRASKIANHEDKPSCLPALVTMHNPCPSRPFTGGDFLLTECGLRLKYGIGDVIIVNGARQHAVLPITSGKGCIRHSMVHFSREGPETHHLC